MSLFNQRVRRGRRANAGSGSSAASRVLAILDTAFSPQRGHGVNPTVQPGKLKLGEANTSPSWRTARLGFEPSPADPVCAELRFGAPSGGLGGGALLPPKGAGGLRGLFGPRPPHFRDGSSTLSPTNKEPITKCGGERTQRAWHRVRASGAPHRAGPGRRSAPGCVAPGWAQSLQAKVSGVSVVFIADTQLHPHLPARTHGQGRCCPYSRPDSGLALPLREVGRRRATPPPRPGFLVGRMGPWQSLAGPGDSV